MIKRQVVCFDLYVTWADILGLQVPGSISTVTNFNTLQDISVNMFQQSISRSRFSHTYHNKVESLQSSDSTSGLCGSESHSFKARRKMSGQSGHFLQWRDGRLGLCWRSESKSRNPGEVLTRSLTRWRRFQRFCWTQDQLSASSSTLLCSHWTCFTVWSPVNCRLEVSASKTAAGKDFYCRRSVVSEAKMEDEEIL